MDRKPYQIITGDELFNVTEDSKEYLIEGIVGKRDYITIVAEPKMGKTILAQQMACSITSGEDFLGIFKVARPGNVWYFATEGRGEDLKDRFVRINQMTPFDKDRLKLIPCNFRFNTTIGANSLNEIKLLLKDSPPITIFVDAIYRSIAGSLIKDDIVNEFHHQIGLLQSEYDCMVCTIHHMKKASKDMKTGNILALSDKDMYGSTFLLGAVDHCLWLENDKKSNNSMYKVLRCDTQRSGKIIESVRIKLRQPEPLGFEIVSKYTEEKERIIELLTVYKEGFSIEDLERKIGKGRSSMYSVKKELDMEGLLEYGKKEGSSQLLWRLKKS